jgi:SAM-dependent methyltransferase
MKASYNATAWGRSNILKYFETNRNKRADIYPSEWYFIEDLLIENVEVLDIGCAQGGFVSIFKEYLKCFTYTGLDINAEMIRKAKSNFPNHQFYTINEGDYSPLQGNKYDLVLLLGIMHLHEGWRKTLKNAWQHTKHNLIFDIRETDQQTIEDKVVSYMKMDFGECDERLKIERLPYNIINSDEVEKFLSESFPDAAKIEKYGYLHTVTSSAVTPLTEVLTRTWSIAR